VRAELLCERVLQRAPGNPEALHLLAILRLRAGRTPEAIPLLRRALQADENNVRILDALGVALLMVEDYPQAEQEIRRMLALGVATPVTHMRLGIALAAQSRLNDAIPCFEQAVRRAPDLIDAHYNLGNALLQLRRPEDALACFRRALALNPDHVDAHNAMGRALRQLGRLDDAISAYRRALELNGGHVLAHHNMGNALLDQGKLEEAAGCFERSITLNPDFARAYNGLGVVLLDQGRLEQAVTCFGRALTLNADFAEPQYNLAVARLFRHEFESGWPGYERRLEFAEVRKTLRKDPDTVDQYERLPRWRGPGEAVAGGVAIWAEQGIGDHVLFSTLIPELIETGVPFVYEVDRRLLNAYERSFPGSRFVALEEPPQDALRQASRVLLAGSLPGLFRRSRESFARQPRRLLSALPERVAHYRGRMEALGPGLKVALSWRSTREGRLGRGKSVPLIELAPLLALSGAHLVDVQYGDTRAERQATEDATGVRLLHFDEVDYYRDLEEVLAILEACDVLITTSNANAHLAGALGKPVWLLYLADKPPFHYWAHDGSHRCLWYPSVEIVSAPHLSEWVSLIRYAAERLARHGVTR